MPVRGVEQGEQDQLKYDILYATLIVIHQVADDMAGQEDIACGK